mmetsp:Transcript_107119/g.255732  ORF Transcript_107119/g.255732 Transcript_107119/m.255732 type:complete len:392 (-) Transcript_107119:314-1489(-)
MLQNNLSNHSIHSIHHLSTQRHRTPCCKARSGSCLWGSTNFHHAAVPPPHFSLDASFLHHRKLSKPTSPTTRSTGSRRPRRSAADTLTAVAWPLHSPVHRRLRRQLSSSSARGCPCHRAHHSLTMLPNAQRCSHWAPEICSHPSHKALLVGGQRDGRSHPLCSASKAASCETSGHRRRSSSSRSIATTFQCHSPVQQCWAQSKGRSESDICHMLFRRCLVLLQHSVSGIFVGEVRHTPTRRTSRRACSRLAGRVRCCRHRSPGKPRSKEDRLDPTFFQYASSSHSDRSHKKGCTDPRSPTVTRRSSSEHFRCCRPSFLPGDRGRDPRLVLLAPRSLCAVLIGQNSSCKKSRKTRRKTCKLPNPGCIQLQHRVAAQTLRQALCKGSRIHCSR